MILRKCKCGDFCATKRNGCEATKCEACLRKANSATKKHYALMKERGLCILCGSATAPGHVKCADCIKADRDQDAERKAEGFCRRVTCVDPVCELSTIYCHKHLLEHRRYNQKWKRNRTKKPLK